jgi:hypothetical protein
MRTREHILDLVAISQGISHADSLDSRIRAAVEGLKTRFHFEHLMLLIPEGTENLLMIASHGYPGGGIGAEVRFGAGVIGAAAARQTSVNITMMQRSLALHQAAAGNTHTASDTRIAFPGLVNVQSQVAVPAVIEGEVVLVLFAEDMQIGRFKEDDVQCMQLIANQLAAFIRYAPTNEEQTLSQADAAKSAAPGTLTVRYFEADGSVFFGDDYVVKSLPGRILFKLLSEYKCQRRTEFTKKELRLDPALKLPAVRDNLDTRLILLSRRLDERFPYARIRPSGRGRFSVEIDTPFELHHQRDTAS